MHASVYLQKSASAPRAAWRPDRKARTAAIAQLWRGYATPRAGMPSGSNVARLLQVSAKHLALFALCLLPWAAQAGLDIQHWVLTNGARVYFVENHSLPMLDVSVQFDAGSARDPVGKSGLAGMTQHLLNLGAGNLSEQAIAERLADIGAQQSGSVDDDRASFSLRVLSDPAQRDTAVAILGAMLSAPHFDATILEREKARAIAALRESETQPEFLVERAFSQTIFGNHPYGMTSSETSLSALRREDLIAFHRHHYTTGNLTLTLMGDLNRAEAEKLVATVSAALPAGHAPAPLPPVAELTASSQQVIPHHATQSHIRIGQPGMTRDDPDYFPLLVGNYILGGGGFDSRLTKAVRDQRGLSYSVHSYFSPMGQRGPFQIGLSTRRDATHQALQVVRDTLQNFLDQGPTEAELTQAKNQLVGGFPLRLDSNKKIAQYLSVIAFYRLPLDWLDRYPVAVEKVNREDILRAFRSRVHPDRLATLIVGGDVATAR